MAAEEARIKKARMIFAERYQVNPRLILVQILDWESIVERCQRAITDGLSVESL